MDIPSSLNLLHIAGRLKIFLLAASRILDKTDKSNYCLLHQWTCPVYHQPPTDLLIHLDNMGTFLVLFLSAMSGVIWPIVCHINKEVIRIRVDTAPFGGLRQVYPCNIIINYGFNIHSHLFEAPEKRNAQKKKSPENCSTTCFNFQ